MKYAPRGADVYGRTAGQKAFTLLELLTVIAITGILAALLFSALSKAKNRFADARCMSNMRQLYLGFQMYQQDHEGRFPMPLFKAGTLWPSQEFFAGNDPQPGWGPAAAARPLYPYLKTGRVFQCPKDVGFDLRPVGGKLVKPSLFSVAGISYHYNSGSAEEDGDGIATNGLGGRGIESVEEPSLYMLGFEMPAYGGPIDRPGPLNVYWHRARQPGTGSSQSDPERGPRVSPILFVDGHTEMVNCSNTPGYPDGVRAYLW